VNRRTLSLVFVGIFALLAVVVVAGECSRPPVARLSGIGERCPVPGGDATEEMRVAYEACVKRYRSTVPDAYLTPSGLQMRVSGH